MAFRRFHKISYILDAYKSQDVHCCYNAREAILLRRAATTAGKAVERHMLAYACVLQRICSLGELLTCATCSQRNQPGAFGRADSGDGPC